MDREHEKMQFLGLHGIYHDSFKVISSWRKLFAQISLTLILPSVFIMLCREKISDDIIGNLFRDEFLFKQTQEGDKLWMDQKRAGSPLNSYFAGAVAADWKYFAIFLVVYITVILLLRLLYTAAVVYATASVYAKAEVSFKKVMKVVPRVWKRLLVTFVCPFLLTLVSLVVFIIIFVGLLVLLGDSFIVALVTAALPILYLVGFFYLVIVFQLANVVSVLEDACGLTAMVKSKELIRGKALLASGILVIQIVMFAAMKGVIVSFAMNGSSAPAYRVCVGVVGIPLLSAVLLLDVVLQTILYLVCKAHHREDVDKSALSDHLDVYYWDYVPLRSKDVQLEVYAA